MMPDQEPQAAIEAPQISQAPRPRRGRGHGRRSRHGRRGPRGEHPPSNAAASETPAEATGAVSEVTSDSARERRRDAAPTRPAPTAAVTDAIEEVNRIIATLKETLTDMEDVLETLELAERQKTADEQEIETLRRGLRQLHRPRDGGSHHNREQEHEPR